MRILVFVFLNVFAKCDEISNLSKKPLPFFRRKVEELVEDTTISSKNDDSQSKLVSFLVQNVREIFNAVSDDQTEQNWLGEIHKSTILFTPNRTTKSTLDFFPKSYTRTDDIMLYENLSVTPKPFLSKSKGDKFRVDNTDEFNEKNELVKLSRGLLLLGKAELPLPGDDIKLVSNNETDNATDNLIFKRSCIFCNNLEVSNCNFPKNKLIPSVVCEDDHDVCYSQHTPFGIVDRGCFNVNNNKTIFVCTCNLCNHLSIAELPYMYTKKQEWIENVIEQSRTKLFRTSIFKEMRCLRCEVSSTVMRQHDAREEDNCLEGNLAQLAVQECEEDEICGVIATRSTGSIWRGCVKTPLYNNYLTLCDEDLCNYDDIVSIYDPE